MYVSHFCASLLIIYILVMHIYLVAEGASGCACLGLHAHSLFKNEHIQFALFYSSARLYIKSRC